MDFVLQSSSLTPGQTVPPAHLFNGMGCHGDNLSPELEWKGAPQETKSFAITVFDPDAPTGHGWWHWTVVNIPANVTKIEEGASSKGTLPLGAQEILTDFREAKYGGPCPPKGHGPHRYVFTVHALKTEKLDVNEKANAEEIKDILEKNCLAEASFTVKYER